MWGASVGAWRGSAPAESETPADQVVAWTIEKLVEHYVNTDQAQRALDEHAGAVVDHVESNDPALT